MSQICWENAEYFVYFKLFAADLWRKRTAKARRRNCAALPKVSPVEHHGRHLGSTGTAPCAACRIRERRRKELVGIPKTNRNHCINKERKYFQWNFVM